MQVKVIKIRTKDSKRLESIIDVSSIDKTVYTYNMFYPSIYKAYAIYDMEGNLLYKKGAI